MSFKQQIKDCYADCKRVLSDITPDYFNELLGDTVNIDYTKLVQTVNEKELGESIESHFDEYLNEKDEINTDKYDDAVAVTNSYLDNIMFFELFPMFKKFPFLIYSMSYGKYTDNKNDTIIPKLNTVNRKYWRILLEKYYQNMIINGKY